MHDKTGRPDWPKTLADSRSGRGADSQLPSSMQMAASSSVQHACVEKRFGA
jgi:hypothetical protein